MHIDTVKIVSEPLDFRPSPLRLAGHQPVRSRPTRAARFGLVTETVRQAGQDADAPASSGTLLVQVDGPTVVEVAGLQGAPAALLEGGGWLPAARSDAPGAETPPEASFFGQATNERTPLLGGTAEADSLVLVGVGGAVFCVTANGRGEWTLDTALAMPMSGRFDLGADGLKELLITSVDSAGNSRGIAGVFELDTVAPLPPSLETRVVHRDLPMLSGRAEAGSEMTIAFGGALYTVKADVVGRWCLDLRDAQAVSGALVFGLDGPCAVGLACADAAGNTSYADAGVELQTRRAREASACAAAWNAGDGQPDDDASPLLAAVADATRRLLAGFGGRRSSGKLA
jgi:hypothetical protein